MVKLSPPATWQNSKRPKTDSHQISSFLMGDKTEKAGNSNDFVVQTISSYIGRVHGHIRSEAR
jgi:hypothetical protein